MKEYRARCMRGLPVLFLKLIAFCILVIMCHIVAFGILFFVASAVKIITYVIADNKNTRQKKFYWCVVGVFFIWFINCCRVSLLLLALQNNWSMITGVDQHTMFNVIAYSLVFIMIRTYSTKSERTLLPVLHV